MKINQFAYVPTSHEQILKELADIRFITPKTKKVSDPVMLYRQFLMKFLLEKQGHATRERILSTIMASPDQSVDEYTKTSATVSKQAFYNVALQLLQFEVGLDYDLSDPIKTMHDLGLPVADVEDPLNRDTLIDAWYLLLNTRTKYGQTLIDYLAGQGYYAQFGRDSGLKKPLFFNGKSQAVFNTSKLIREIVYVEAPIDSDHDGNRDLVKVEVIRPNETNKGIKIPVVFTASPYDQGTNDETADKLTHDVSKDQLTHKTPNDDTLADVTADEPNTSLPPETVPVQMTDTVEETFTKTWTYSLNDYLLAHGFAVVYSAGIGTKDSDGYRTTGSIDETISTTAVIEWLNHQRVAFTNRTDRVGINAWWSTGNVGMTGRSYLGTLANAAVLSGVAGLKTAVVEAGISNWYDYYRENGLVVAPGGFQGEDADILAELTYSRKQRANEYLKTKQSWQHQLAAIEKAEDRETGNYNQFWDARNYLTSDKAQADVLLVHGLNDWNVKPSHAYHLRNLLKKDNLTLKTVLHQGQHEYLNNFRSVDFTDMVNLWLVNKLYEIDNNADKVIPDVLVQDNVKEQTWHTVEDWGTDNSKQVSLADDWFTNVNDNQEFSNHMADDQFKSYVADTAKWRAELYKTSSSAVDKNTIKLLSQPLEEDMTINGSVHLSLNVTSDQNIGMLSAKIVDFGEAHRLTPTPTVLEPLQISLGYNWRKDNLREFTYEKKLSQFKKITDGHINLQNRHNSYQVDEVEPGKAYQVEFDLEPEVFRVIKGHRIGIILFSADLDYTIRTNQEINYQIDLAKSEISLPIQ
ncbi:Xaa-Pro dipeptidyl-peptidase [Lentilactobacillus sp. SPB1-3]|uniref:Xaa-Pro dipeptidyl-peptidase n=1 Tax=Lentilactobacillus terminaliae TaxID=3003483 RepID=A0ACD5DFE6_9LACO|nr:Xaa-Pro dipeptidyl-peptidase [Lentilactobacillus sp. SPB1-3]MCZ0976648.1 Xaa-Pro dipeptidyl-peptidase [Lentilactobacillus sp. SPB1-3]